MICKRKASHYYLVVVALLSAALVFGLTGIGETAESKPITLKFTTGDPITSYNYDYVFLAFKRAVEDESKGRLKVDLYMGSTLSALKDNQEAITGGIADMGLVADSYAPDRFVLSNVFMLPPLWSNATEITSFMLNEIMDNPKYGMADEVKKLGLRRFSAYVMAPYELYTLKKAVNKIEDLKGMRIRSNSKGTSDFLQALGAIPVSMSADDTIEALQKGGLDGATGTAAQSFIPLGWYELGKPGYLIDIGGAPTALGSFCINQKVYDGLSPDLQKVIDKAGRTFLAMGWAYTFDGYTNLSVGKMMSVGNKRIVWSDAEKNKVHARTANMLDNWAKATDAKGKPGTALLQAIRDKFAKK